MVNSYMHSRLRAGYIQGHIDDDSVWTIPSLMPTLSEPTVRIYPPRLGTIPQYTTSIIRVTGEIIGSDPAEPPGFQSNNTVEIWYVGGQNSDGDVGVNITGISDRSPEPGRATTFTIKAENYFHRLQFPYSVSYRSRDFRNELYGVRVKIELSPGLAFAGTPTPPSGTTFNATTGIWNVGTLEHGSDNAKSFPVAVNLTSDSLGDLPLEERCLTAKITSAVPWFGSDPWKRQNDTASACLGDGPELSPMTRGELVLFNVHDCVGVTSYPCTSADTLEILAKLGHVDHHHPAEVVEREITRGLGLGGTGNFLKPERIVVQVRDPIGRVYDGLATSLTDENTASWVTGTTKVYQTDGVRIGYSRAGFNDHIADWATMVRTVRVSGLNGAAAPGRTRVRVDNTTGFTFYDPDPTHRRSPFTLSSASTLLAPYFLEFTALGTYIVEFAVEATRTDSTVYTGSGTYTFHVGPMAELEVRDRGANPAVGADQQAYTIKAVNNGPDEAPAVRVTGLPRGADYGASMGEYDPATGVWTIGKLGVGVGATLTLIASDADTEFTVEIENTQDYRVVIDGTAHTTHYYDHIKGNNSATIAARTGTGLGHPEVPDGVTLVETPVANILMWEPVERVNGFRVTHYEVERSASPWTTLSKVVRGPMYVDMDLRPGQLMQYRVRAVNIFGVGGPWSVPTTTGPDAPGDFTAEQLASGEVRLTWTKPDGNGAEITGYTIQVSTNAGGSWAGTGARPGADDTSWIHRHLSVGPVRLYRIRASTANGPGPWAQATSAEVGRPFLIANYDGASRVALSWTMPSGHAVPVQSWELEHSANGVNWSRLATAPASDGMSYIHSGLSPGDFRHYRVRAVTALGHGPWSEPATAATAAGVPRNFRAQANGPNEIMLSWNKPTGDAEIWEYQIERKTEGVDWTHLAAVYSEEETSYVDDGLSPGGTWSYRVRAVSIAAGNLLAGEWSAEASATTDSGGPEPPKDPTAAADGENAIKLSWTEPEDNGSPITGYRIEHSTDGGATWALLRARHSGTTYSHTGLPSGTSHHYRVAAINRNGRSPFSRVAQATTAGTPATVPGMPADLRVTGVDRNRVSIAWSPPADDGGARVTGYDTGYLGPCAADPADLCQSGAVRASGTSASIGGLNVAGTYDFMVRAINAVGAGEWSDPVQADIAPEARGKVVVTPSSLTVTEGGSATYRVKLSHEPAQPVQLGLFWEDPDNDLSLALAGYQGMLLLPGNYAPPEGAMWDGWAYRWNVGIPITVEAEEDDDSEDGTVVIHHDVWTAPADLLGNPPDWAEDPVYHFMTGPAVKVTVRDND